MSKTRKILTVIFGIIFCYCLVYLIDINISDYNEAKQVEELEQIMAKDKTILIDTEQEKSNQLTELEHIKTYENESNDEKEILTELQDLYEENPDIIGWLKIEGTKLSYPVMQSLDNPDFYLNHGFDKLENKNGLPLLDKKCNINSSDTNLIIHGHNMKSGMIFGELMKYKQESYYKEHPIIQFSTLYESGEYEIISVFLSQVYKKSDDVFKYYQFIEAQNKEEFDEFISNIKEMSLYEIGSSAQYGDSLITLSTCEYSTENGRFAVVARKISD